MAKLYLITGFLGTGKTTFLKKFIWQFDRQKTHIIVNEYGKEGVDGQLLKELGTTLDEINNGSIFCSCRLDKFEEVLENALKGKPDVILVEASGLSNPANVRKILAQENKFPGLEYMGSICLLDAKRFHKVYETATVVKKQIGISDIILINKRDLATREELDHIHETVRRHRPDISIYETSFGEIRPEWIKNIKNPVQIQKEPEIQKKDLTLHSYLLRIRENFRVVELERFTEMFLENTYRVKGFVRAEGKSWYLDCVGSLFSLKPYEGEAQNWNEIVVLSGNGLPASRSIKEAMKWYPEKIESFELVRR